MGGECFTISRAVFVRVMFTAHGLFSIFRLYVVTQDPNKWYLTTALMGLLMETSITIYKKRGQEWKWSVLGEMFCVDLQSICISSVFINKNHPARGLSSLPHGLPVSDRAKFGVSLRGPRPKFNIRLPTTHRIYMSSFIDVGPAISEPWGFENVDTAWTDVWPVLQDTSGYTTKNTISYKCRHAIITDNLVLLPPPHRPYT